MDCEVLRPDSATVSIQNRTVATPNGLRGPSLQVLYLYRSVRWRRRMDCQVLRPDSATVSIQDRTVATPDGIFQHSIAYGHCYSIVEIFFTGPPFLCHRDVR